MSHPAPARFVAHALIAGLALSFAAAACSTEPVDSGDDDGGTKTADGPAQTGDKNGGDPSSEGDDSGSGFGQGGAGPTSDEGGADPGKPGDPGGAACCASADMPGCAADTTIEACVCAEDSYCCEEAWDGLCVQAVSELGCGTCPDLPPDNSEPCCEAHSTTGCVDTMISDCVCAEDSYCCDVEWDELCVANVDQHGCGMCGGGEGR
jgi:hypothetical protein